MHTHKVNEVLEYGGGGGMHRMREQNQSGNVYNTMIYSFYTRLALKSSPQFRSINKMIVARVLICDEIKCLSALPPFPFAPSIHTYESAAAVAVAECVCVFVCDNDAYRMKFAHAHAFLSPAPRLTRTTMKTHRISKPNTKIVLSQTPFPCFSLCHS